MQWKARLLVQLFAAAVLSSSAAAGSSLDVVIRVIPSSGVCATSTQSESVSVTCGRTSSEHPYSPPLLVTSSLFGNPLHRTVPLFVDLSDASLDQGSTSAEYQFPNRSPWPIAGEPHLRQVGVLPAASETGAAAIPLYAGGVNLSGWRVVSTNNVEHVELTISW